jgi:hypothetical protein
MGSYANHAEAMTDIAEHIVGFYKSMRLHSKLGNLPPNAFAAIGIQTSYRCVRKTWPTHNFYIWFLWGLCASRRLHAGILKTPCAFLKVASSTAIH